MAEPGFSARLASVEIPASDPEALARFYAEAFGWSAGEPAAGGGWRRLAATSAGAGAGVEVAIAAPDALGTGQPVAVIEIRGAPLAEVLDRIVAAGGRVETPPRPVGSHAFATFRDPAGNLFGLWQP